MPSGNSGELAARDWTPWLVKAPHLIQNLGCCVALAATREVSRIRLTGNDLSTPDLASNLVDVANQGQNAFLEAFADLLDISNKTTAMGSNGGYFDQLDEMFGETTADKASSRLLERLQKDIDTCHENGQRTAEEFKKWRQGVNRVQRALEATQSGTEKKISDTQDEFQGLRREREFQEAVLTNTMYEARTAQERFDKIYEVHQGRQSQLAQYASNAVGCASLGWWEGALTNMAGAGISGFMLILSSEEAAQAEKHVNEKRKAAGDLDLAMKKLALSMDSWQHREDKLKELTKIVCAVLDLLKGLAADIMSLLAYFAIMNQTIRQLVEEHRANSMTVKDIQADVASGSGINQWDYKQFKMQIVIMKKVSLTVAALSTLYSTVITDIINPGFERVIEASHSDLADQGGAIALATKQAGMNSYLVHAESICRKMSHESNRKLRKQLEGIDQSVARSESRTRRYVRQGSSGSASSQQDKRGLVRLNIFGRRES